MTTTTRRRTRQSRKRAQRTPRYYFTSNNTYTTRLFTSALRNAYHKIDMEPAGQPYTIDYQPHRMTFKADAHCTLDDPIPHRIADQKILTLSSLEDVIRFERRYHVIDKYYYIDWVAVARHYAGIEIRGYTQLRQELREWSETLTRAQMLKHVYGKSFNHGCSFKQHKDIVPLQWFRGSYMLGGFVWNGAVLRKVMPLD